MRLALIIFITLLFVCAVAAAGAILGFILLTIDIDDQDTPDDQDTEDGAGPQDSGDSGQ